MGTTSWGGSRDLPFGIYGAWSTYAIRCIEQPNSHSNEYQNHTSFYKASRNAA
ncbi:hypothetical protein EMGBS15_09360, partial [Filimonas sp.]